MRKRSRKLYRVKLDAAVLGPLLAELPGVGDESPPVEVIGWRTRAGELIRARAVYDTGLQVELFLTFPKDGKQRLSSYKLQFKTIIAGSGKAAVA